MATAFEQILELKQRKEDQALTEMRGARLAVEQAARAVEQCRIDAETYSAQLQVRQAQLFDELENKVCERSDIEDVREKIARMRGTEASLYQKIDEAEKARVKAAEGLEGARLAHLRTVKNVEKFRQLVSIEKTEAIASELVTEDKEMEEFVRLGEPADF
jgi:flagellar biosynthesis chaperone FliJ